MLNSAPKLHKLMPEIPYVRFSCGNSNIRDLLQILANPQEGLKIQESGFIVLSLGGLSNFSSAQLGSERL
jgi:hypothetical protein